MNKVHFSSNSNEWSTPQRLFEQLNAVYKFTLDPCSTEENHKCPTFFTREDDGLTKSWKGHSVFMNPPYGRVIGKWIEKAYKESRDSYTTVVCLIPARTDTRYWHDYCMKANKIYFIQGRVKFENSEKELNSAPFPSAIVVFNGNPVFQLSVKSYEQE